MKNKTQFMVENATYANAWSLKQGVFSYKLAKNLLKYIKTNNITVKNCLDICSGTGEFLNVLHEDGKKCIGTEISMQMIDFCTAKYPNIKFLYTKDMLDFKTTAKFDLISCNHNMLNLLPTLTNWGDFFKKAHNQLNKDGIFVFDFNTKLKLKNLNEATFEKSDNIDYISKINQIEGNKCTFLETYFIKESMDIYKKTSDSFVEYFFENEDVLKTLKKASFSKIITMDINFNEVTMLKDKNRIHVVAVK